MRWYSARLFAVALATVPVSAAAGQRQPVTEIGVAALATWARRDFVGGGVSFGHRPGGGRSRLGLLLAGGRSGGRAAGRFEGTVQFLLNPATRKNVTLSGAAGITVVAVSGSPTTAYLLLFLGIERAAALRWGWFAEAGLGGGVRLAAGVKQRRR